jgi:putative MFS transporter
MTSKNAEPPSPIELSPARKRRFLVRLTTVIVGGMFLDGYILGIVGTVIGTLSTDLNLSLAWEGLIGASALIGIFIGGPFGGMLSDKFGRKPLFTATLALFIVGSVLQFFVGEPWQLFLVRLLMGIAIGADYSVGWPMQAEFSPTRLRGRLLAFGEVGWYVGYVVAFIAGYLLVTYTEVDWRIILASSTVPAVILFVSRFGLPESPRWLMHVHRIDDAHRVAHKYLESPTDITDIEQHEQPRKGTFAMLFNRENRKATIFVSVFWFCAVTPYFAISTFAASVLEGYGLSDGLFGAILLNALALAGVIVSVILIEKVGRRKLTNPPQWIAFAVLLIIGLWTGAPPIVVLVLFLLFSFFNAMYTALTGVYPGEVFPTEIRGLGTGFATAFSRVGAALGTFLLPISIDSLGIGVTMLFAAGIALIGVITSQILAPETMGKTLSETSHAMR